MKLNQFNDDSSDSAGWMATFADLMTLLLVFFILMFSMSSVKTEQFQRAIASIQTTLAGKSSIAPLDSLGTRIVPNMELFPDNTQSAESDSANGSNATNLNDTNPSLDQANEAPVVMSTQPSIGNKGKDWDKLANTLRSQLYEKELQRVVQVNLPRDGTVTIQVEGGLMFDSGSAYLNGEVDPVMDTLVRLFKEYSSYSINIKGHTDNIPISTPEFESNWELSAVRATTVLRYFVNRGLDPRRFTATGYGDSLPLESNYNEEGRTKNRRIEFVLEKQNSAILH